MKVPQTEPKQVLTKLYSHISALESAINAIHTSGIDQMTVSVLGKFGENYSNNPKGLINKSNYLRNFFKELLGADTQLDSFYNPEIGRVFVTGFIVPIFLELVGDKNLGALSGGIYGILRGLGISETKASSDVKKLNEGKYVLLVRGKRFDIENLEAIIDRLEKQSKS